jgi:hypothetical protein
MSLGIKIQNRRRRRRRVFFFFLTSASITPITNWSFLPSMCPCSLQASNLKAVIALVLLQETQENSNVSQGTIPPYTELQSLQVYIHLPVWLTTRHLSFFPFHILVKQSSKEWSYRHVSSTKDTERAHRYTYRVQFAQSFMGCRNKGGQ